MRVGIVGVGHIGGALAHTLLEDQNIHLSLFDLSQKKTEGKALDLFHSSLARGQESFPLHVAKTVEDLMDCQVVVVTAGKARTPGMQRQDLLYANGEILKGIGHRLRGFQGIVIVVTNPVDTMTWWVMHHGNLPKKRVLGMAGVLDSARLRGHLSQALGVPARLVGGWVLGAHNECMVPLRASVSLGGVPVSDTLLPFEMWKKIGKETQNAGAKIVEFLEQGSAFYGPAESIKQMIQAIFYKKNIIMPASAFLEGEYNTSGICLGVPLCLDHQGIEKIFQWDLAADEIDLWKVGAEGVGQSMKILQGLFS